MLIRSGFHLVEGGLLGGTRPALLGLSVVKFLSKKNSVSALEVHRTSKATKFIFSTEFTSMLEGFIGGKNKNRQIISGCGKIYHREQCSMIVSSGSFDRSKASI